MVGAAKSGTTTLFQALAAQKDVFLPAVKEPHVYAYLADRSIGSHLFTDPDQARRHYRDLYEGVGGETAVGDCSTTNLVVAGAADAIASDVPHARIVAILRQPVDRAFSHFCHFVGAGGEDTTDFAAALRRPLGGYPFTYDYLAWGRYGRQLRPFYERFGPDRVLVHLYDDLCADSEAVVRTTLRFLGVDGVGPIPPVGRANERRRPSPATPPGRGGLRHRLLRRAPQPAPVPVLDPTLRAELTATFEGDIRDLETLIGRDLARWRI